MPPSANEIVEVITRKSVPPGQITLFKALYESPRGLSKAELALQIRDSDEKSLVGVLAALSKRVNKTQFHEKPGFKFLIDRDRVEGQLVYIMRPELREAVEHHPALYKLCTAMAMPVEEIFKRFTEDPKSWPVLP